MKKKINKNKISILITNFNKDKFIKNCLRSCLNQTYKNIEVFLFDDYVDNYDGRVKHTLYELAPEEGGGYRKVETIKDSIEKAFSDAENY